MTQPTNTFDSYDGANTIREDLSDIIYNISPTDTPVLSMSGQGSASNTLHEWMTDELDAVDGNNAQIEGDDKDADTITAPARLQNYCQISDKTITISGTQQEVDNAGRANEMGYQIAKKAQSLKRDMEAIITGNQAPVAGDGTTARKLRGLESWYKDTNSNRGAGGSEGSSSAGATDGTQRALKESHLKDVLQKTWDAGGDPDYIIAGGKNKQKISGFAGNANRNTDNSDQKLVTSVDVYVSDFGQLQVVPNRFSRGRSVHVIQSDMLCIDYLRQFQDTELAKTGDSDKRLVLAEYTLAVKNQDAHGVVADLTV